MAVADFKQAFDRVNKVKLWSVLQKVVIKGKLYIALKEMYSRSKQKFIQMEVYPKDFVMLQASDNAVCYHLCYLHF